MAQDAFSTAIHEIGHALVACALRLALAKVWVEKTQDLRWSGKCELVDPHPPGECVREAFTMGGALLQLILAPASLGKHLATFQPTLLEHSEDLKKDPTPLEVIGWAPDFSKCRFHLHAVDIKNGAPCERPHILKLETILRRFFENPSVAELALNLAPRLANSGALEGQYVRQEFDLAVAPEKFAELTTFVVGVPDRPTVEELWREIREDN